MKRVLVLAAVLVACGSKPWKAKDAPKRPPDEQFRTGHEVGYDAWIWHCYEGQRIVITQGSSALLGASAPHVNKGPCGSPLPTEADFPPPDGRSEIPDGYRWPGSAPAPAD